MSERIQCCIPFCRRTMKQDGRTGEFMCGKHWRLAPLPMRQAFTRKQKWFRGESYRRRHLPLHRCVSISEMWRRIKRAAIERAAGIG